MYAKFWLQLDSHYKNVRHGKRLFSFVRSFLIQHAQKVLQPQDVFQWSIAKQTRSNNATQAMQEVLKLRMKLQCVLKIKIPCG